MDLFHCINWCVSKIMKSISGICPSLWELCLLVWEEWNRREFIAAHSTGFSHFSLPPLEGFPLHNDVRSLVSTLPILIHISESPKRRNNLIVILFFILSKVHFYSSWSHFGMDVVFSRLVVVLLNVTVVVFNVPSLNLMALYSTYSRTFDNRDVSVEQWGRVVCGDGFDCRRKVGNIESTSESR